MAQLLIGQVIDGIFQLERTGFKSEIGCQNVPDFKSKILPFLEFPENICSYFFRFTSFVVVSYIAIICDNATFRARDWGAFEG